MHLLDAALVDGQISSDEHHERLGLVLHADDSRQVARALLDLQAPPPPPPSPPTVGDRMRAALGEARDRWRAADRQTRIATRLWVALVVGATVTTVVSAVVHEEEPPPALTPARAMDGFEEVVTAYEEQFDTTLVGGLQFDVGGERLDDHFGTAHVPVEGETERYEQWILSGDDFTETDRHSSGQPLVDLAALDPDRVEQDLARAWDGLGVEDPDKVMIVVRSSTDEEPTITYVVANEYRESGQLVTDLEGTELRRSPFEPPAG